MRCMHFIKVATLLLFVTICLSACSALNSRNSENIPINIVLPYFDDIFIFTPSCCFDEYHQMSFRFSEGRQGDRRGWFYEAVNFRPHIEELINIMNSITPVLVDATNTDTSDNNIPFRGITHSNYLYSLQLFSFQFNDPNLRMRVHEARNIGYLYFLIFGWEEISYDHLIMRDDLLHHSLYRITLDELEKIIEFAEGLERGRVLFCATPPPNRISQVNHILFIAIGIGIAILMRIIIFLFVKRRRIV